MIKVNFRFSREDLFLIAFMVLFILLIYIFAHYILLPDLEKYVEIKDRYSFHKNSEISLLQNSQDVKIEYEIVKKYKPFLEHMEKFDQEKLEKILHSYFDEIMIEQLEKKEGEKAKKIQESLYKVSLTMRDTRDFFQFLKDIKSNGLPIGIVEPIEMEKNEKGIQATFTLRTYSF